MRGPRGSRGPIGPRGAKGRKGYKGHMGRTRVITHWHNKLHPRYRRKITALGGRVRHLRSRYNSLKRTYAAKERRAAAAAAAARARAAAAHRLTHVVIHRAPNTIVLQGTVINYLNGRRVHHVEVKIKTLAGATVATTHSNGRGHWAVNVAAGTYKVFLSHTGLVGRAATILIKPTMRRAKFAAGMSPVLPPGGVRFVLTWGNHPRDLDSFVSFPGNKCKIAWYHRRCRSSSVGDASLDLDATRGSGPETVTIKKPIKGTYQYEVHQYSNDGTLANSKAVVQVYYGNKVKIFRAKKAAAGQASNGKITGKKWRVLKWVVTNPSANGRIASV